MPVHPEQAREDFRRRQLPLRRQQFPLSFRELLSGQRRFILTLQAVHASGCPTPRQHRQRELTPRRSAAHQLAAPSARSRAPAGRRFFLKHAPGFYRSRRMRSLDCIAIPSSGLASAVRLPSVFHGRNGLVIRTNTVRKPHARLSVHPQPIANQL